MVLVLAFASYSPGLNKYRHWQKNRKKCYLVFAKKAPQKSARNLTKEGEPPLWPLR
jgi:hypothetical protein